jgi:hypothetical protein
MAGSVLEQSSSHPAGYKEKEREKGNRDREIEGVREAEQQRGKDAMVSVSFKGRVPMI